MQMELPPDRLISKFVRRGWTSTKGKPRLVPVHSDWDRKERNSQEVLSLDEALHESFIGRENSKLLLDCCMRMCLSKDEDQGVLEPDRCSMKEFKDKMDNLTLKEQYKIKVRTHFTKYYKMVLITYLIYRLSQTESTRWP